MKQSLTNFSTIDARIADRLKSLRTEKGWSLDELSERSSISRATLSRLENGSVSPNTAVLGKLCSAYSLPLSRLILMVEEDFPALVPSGQQEHWQDADAGFIRRSVSPPAGSLAGEVLACELEPNACITYDRPPRPGLEHHLVLTEGELMLTLGDEEHRLTPGDCLRYQLTGSSKFKTAAAGAKYFLFMV